MNQEGGQREGNGEASGDAGAAISLDACRSGSGSYLRGIGWSTKLPSNVGAITKQMKLNLFKNPLELRCFS